MLENTAFLKKTNNFINFGTILHLAKYCGKKRKYKRDVNNYQTKESGKYFLSNRMNYIAGAYKATRRTLDKSRQR